MYLETILCKSADTPTHDETVEISILSTSNHYLLDLVYIVAMDDEFRLKVMENRELVVDKKYKSAGGAKIAFSRMYCYRTSKPNIDTDWSIFFQPTPQWMEEQGIKLKVPAGSNL